MKDGPGDASERRSESAYRSHRCSERPIPPDAWRSGLEGRALSGEGCQIATHLDNSLIIGAINAIECWQRPLKLGAGAGQIPQIPQHLAEVVPISGDVGMVRAQNS